ncbi:MAG TPA: hypothetical protein VGG39_28760 [Polyangiaceae bacterium]|jgi:hypothetical protein
MTTRKNVSQAIDTASPQRNFTLATEERVRAIAAGAPAFTKRLRAIEDLEEGIVRVIVERCREAAPGTSRERLTAHARASAPLRALERLNDLVGRHNRYYPIEANLPMRPPTGELMDRTGERWRPMPLRSLEELVARALARLVAAGE